MPPIEISICAEGSLPTEEISELADIGIHGRTDQVVLEGTVHDQAALVGVLERLRRAGLHIREVAPAAEAARGVEVARIAVGGRVGDIVRAVLGDAPVTEGDDMTTAEVVLSSADVLFDVIERLGGLGLELRSVHVGRSASPGPDPAGS